MTFGGPGLTTQLTAIGTYTQGSHPATTRDITNEVTWTSSTPEAVFVCNTPGTPDNVLCPTKGLLTSLAACSNIPITASAPGFSGIITGSMTANVTSSATTVEPLTSLTIVPATQTALAINQPVQFHAIGTLSSGATVDLTSNGWPVPGTLGITKASWSSSDTTVANFLTPTTTPAGVATPGLVTSLSAGSTTITATAGNPDGTVVTATATFTVSVPAVTEPLVSLAVTPSAPTVQLSSQTTNFIAVGTTGTGASVNLTNTTWPVPGTTLTVQPAQWYSSNQAVASFAPNTVATATLKSAGVTVITAIATNPADQTVVTGSAVLTVTAPAVTEPYIALAIVPASQTLTAVGQQAKFIAIGTTGSGTTVDLTGQATWSSSDANGKIVTQVGNTTPAVAMLGGNVFAAAGNGAAAITATYTITPATATSPAIVVTGSAALTVAVTPTPEPLLSTTIYPSSPSVASPGLTSQLADIGTFSSVPITQDVTKGIASYPITTSWSSSTPAVATVTTVCPTGLSALSCTNSACPGTSNAGVCTSCPGGTAASGAYCATATFNPTTPVGLVTGLSQGTTAIMAVSSNPDGSQVIASVPFSVTGGSTEQFTALTIIPGAISATSSAQQNQFIALGTKGTLQYDVTSQVVWKSNTSTVASICTADDPSQSPSCTPATDGLVTAASAGSTIITATLNEPDGSQVVAQATYTVTIGASPEPLISINVVPLATIVSNKGMTQQYIAFGTFTTIPTLRDITDSVTWITLEPNLVSINSAGTPGEPAGLATAMGYEGLGVIYAEDTTANPDGTLVLSNPVTFTCDQANSNPPICNPSVAPSLLATLTVFNAGSNDTNWLITVPSGTQIASGLTTCDVTKGCLIHCGPGSEIAGYGNSVCTGTYAANTNVTITASLAGDSTSTEFTSTFGGWTANCDTGVLAANGLPEPDLSSTCALPTPLNPIGTGYTTAAGLPTSTNDVGSGAVISITASAGNLTSCTATTPGSGYKVGDLVYPTQAGATGSSCLVAAVNGTGGVSMMIASLETSGDPSGLYGDQSVGALFYGLTLQCSAVTSWNEGEANFNSGVITVTNGTRPDTFSVVGTLPAGLTLNTTTGAVTGTPTASGSFSITATDADGTNAGVACAITIN
jgi:hypothetical protein